MIELKKEGFWHSDAIVKWEGIKYPNPIPNSLSEEEAKEIHSLIKEKEEEAKQLAYRGTSQSRITGERLGNKEYKTDSWVWPGDFADHYVLEHRVKPTDEFLDYIGWKSPKGIKYGLIAVDPLQEGEMKDILHFCGYWEKPTEIDAEYLKKELMEDEEFGLTDIADRLVIFDAPDYIVQEYIKEIK